MQVSALISTLARVATVSTAGNTAGNPDRDQKTQLSAASALGPQQEQQIRQLGRIDQEVRAHEQAHLNAARGIAVSNAHFRYQTGPDGKRYAIAGDVQIDTSSTSDNPGAVIRKAAAIVRVALAPAKPSIPDQQVANQAQAMAQNAQSALLKQQFSNNTSSSGQTINNYV